MIEEPSTPNHGPKLLEERPLMGILVHPLAFFTGGIAAAIVYFVANNKYTRTNARNALNWYISALLLAILAVGMFFLGGDAMTIGDEVIDILLLPEPLKSITFLIGISLLIAVKLLTVGFSVVATIMAIFGNAWEYPFARDFVRD
ncbi:DUF4870 domain-containing protein [Natrarchaeobius sp. A-rgal3]|uniref:DUF4870 domain-containing protein n=1 Tax=Natrarchaeobius versutus TaxID=1679078 RepID=UPI003510104B